MKVLIVDDSVVFRMAISEALKGVSGVEICGTASNGQIAIDFLKKNEAPDLIILDMEMPVMDGIATIEAIRNINKQVIIICFSALTSKGAELTLKALRLGANDFVTKQEASSTTMDASLKMIQSVLVPKIHAFETVITKARSTKNSSGITTNHEAITGTNATVAVPIHKSLKVNLDTFLNDISKSPDLILIASSTGGPEALTSVFKGVTVTPKIPILLVQHMPPIFTNTLAQMLDKQTSFLQIKEAQHGETLQPGVCYIAPGDFHMRLSKDLTLTMDQGEKVSFVRPSATVLFQSVANNFPGKTLSIVMTGMGDDGAAGLNDLLAKGDYAYIQDEATSVVWGMPGAVRAKFARIQELPLADIPKLLNKVFEKRNMLK